LKGIWVLAVIAAFVAGSIVTGAIAFADDDDDDGNKINPVVTIVALLTDPIFGLEEIKNEVRNIEGNVTSSEFGLEEIKDEISALKAFSLTQILTIDRTGPSTITATSSSEFIVTFCADNSNNNIFDFLTITRNFAQILIDSIDQSTSSNGTCLTVGGSAGDTLRGITTEIDGVTQSTAVMQARFSAISSLT